MGGKFDKVIKKELGSGLLSENSRQFAVNEFKVTYIPLDKLRPNAQNEGFSMADIEELMTSIREVGLEQNLVVVHEGDHYRILTGHRRYAALCRLRDEGLEKFNSVPCIVKDLSRIELPLSEKSKEVYAIATTNLENRRCTDNDKLKLMAMLSGVYDELRRNGYAQLGKRRDFLAERLGISSAGVQILSFVDKNLDESFRAAFQSDRLPLMVANEIAHLPPETQRAFAAECAKHPERAISVKDVRRFAEQRRKAAEPIQPAEMSFSARYAAAADTLAQVQADYARCVEFTVRDAIALRRLQEEISDRLHSTERILKKYVAEQERAAKKKSKKAE